MYPEILSILFLLKFRQLTQKSVLHFYGFSIGYIQGKPIEKTSPNIQGKPIEKTSPKEFFDAFMLI